MQYTHRQNLITTAAVVLLTACGGGGGGSGDNNPPVPAAASFVNQAPNATFNLTPVQGNAPLTVTGDATPADDPDGAIVSYQWTFADSTAIGVTAQHTFTLPGRYNVSLQVTDNSGARTTATRMVTVAESSTPVTLSGTVHILNASAVDADVNDRLTRPRSNNAFATAQQLPTPLVLGGFANRPHTGQTTGHLYSNGDAADFYHLQLGANSRISLQISEADADLDLRLWDANRNLVDASMGLGQTETLTIKAAGHYFVEVVASQGASNYVLLTGDLGVTRPRQATRLSDPFVSGQMILRPKFVRALATAPLIAGATLVQQAAPDANWAHTASLYEMAGEQPLVLPDGARISQRLRKRLQTLQFMKNLQGLDFIEWVEPNLLIQSHGTPSDSLYNRQWHYQNIHLPNAWQATTGSQDVTVAVIDTGVRADHPDLQTKLVGGYDFISNPGTSLDGDGIDANPNDPGDRQYGSSSSFHGTHVAGTIGAHTDNRQGIAGVGWQTRIMPLRVLGKEGGTTFDIVQALRYAAGMPNESGMLPEQPADIINLSLGTDFSSQTTQDLIHEIVRAGIFVVASAGNDATSTPQYPAAYDGVIGVAATTINDEPAHYSNFGDSIDVAAPGGSNGSDINGDGLADGIISTMASDADQSITFGYSVLSGTSMAAPHMSGVLALMKSIYPDLHPRDFDLALVNGDLTDDLGAPGRDPAFGWGLVNATKAVAAAQQMATGERPNPGPVLGIAPGQVSFGAFLSELNISARNIGTGELHVTGVTSQATWLAVHPPATADGLGTYRLQAQRLGLASGVYQTRLTFETNASNFALDLSMHVSDLNFQANAGLLYLILVDDDGNTVVNGARVNARQGAYPFTIHNVPPGQYRLFAGTDADDDSLLCDAGETCGAFPTLDAPRILSVNQNMGGLEFETSHRITLGTKIDTADSEPVAPAPLRINKSLAVEL